MSPPKASSCSTCGAGSYCSSSKTKSPGTACPAGTYNPSTGRTSSASCSDCGAGRWSAARAASCTSCAPGYFCGAAAGCKDECPAASPGFFVAGSGYSSQKVCPRGTYSGTAFHVCPPCMPGSYCPDANGCKNKCRVCSAGFYVPEEGQTAQRPCDKAHYCPTTNMTDPIPCPVGFFADETGLAACKICPAGTAAQVGQETCSPCSKGYFAPEAAEICTPCSPGSSCGRLRCDRCASCSPGSFSDKYGASECREVAPGHFTSGARIKQTPCPVGTFANTSGTEGACRPCPVGHACSRGPGTVIPVPCLAGFFNPAASTSECQPCALGHFSMSGAAAECIPAERGHFVDTSGGQPATQQTPCPEDTHQNFTASTSCVRCHRDEYTNSTIGMALCIPRPCCTRSYSVSPLSPSPSSTATVTRTVTPPPTPTSTRSRTQPPTRSPTPSARSRSPSASDPNNSTSVSETGSRRRTFTYSRSYDFNSTSLSLSPPPSGTEGRSSSAAGTESAAEESRSESLPPSGTGTRSKTHPPTPTVDYITPSRTATDSNHSWTPDDPITQSRTFGSPTQEATIPALPLGSAAIGLPAAAQATIQQTTNVVSALTSVAAAPAAMTMQRQAGLMLLIGCPKKNPITDKPWHKDEPKFPSTLLPGYGFGSGDGFFYRGSILGFVILIVVSTLVGYFLLEGVGKYHERDLDEGSAIEEELQREIAAERRQKHFEETGELPVEEEVTTTNPNGNNSSSNNKEDRGDIVAKHVRRIPQVLWSVVGCVLGMWTPSAGLLFATLHWADIIIAVGPLFVLFSIHGYVAHKIRKSVAQGHELKGLMFVESFVMQNAEIDAFKAAVKRQLGLGDAKKADADADAGRSSKRGKSILPDRNSWSARAKRFFETAVGRYLFIGHSFWTRPKGPRGYPARKLLTALGPHVQKWRGPRIVVDLLGSANPFADSSRQSVDTFAEVLAPSTARKQNSFASPSAAAAAASGAGGGGQEYDDDHLELLYMSPERKQQEEAQEAEMNSAVRQNVNTFVETGDYDTFGMATPNVDQLDEGGWLCRIAPHFLFISWWESLTTGFLTGIALAIPQLCPTILVVLAALNVLSFLLFLCLRPFVVPFRNHVMFVMELAVAASSLLVLLFLNDPEGHKNSQIAKWLQIGGAIVGNVGGFALLAGTVVRRGSLKFLKLSLVSQEEQWVLGQVKMSELELEVENQHVRNDDDGEGEDAEMQPVTTSAPKKKKTSKKKKKNQVHQDSWFEAEETLLSPEPAAAAAATATPAGSKKKKGGGGISLNDI